jgi:TusA-related sulfurtransferase
MGDVKNNVDARGLSCPQPAMLTQETLQKIGKGTIEVLVDSSTARENVSRLARKSGWKTSLTAVPESF